MKHAWNCFWAGVCMNFNEYLLWKRTKAKFLAKTYFSCGILNIQKYEKGLVPDFPEMIKLIGDIANQVNRDIYCIDPHCLEPKNFVKTENYYRLIDYGDTPKRGYPFHDFLLRWHKVLEEELKIK